MPDQPNELTCRSCGAALNAADLDRRLGIITCSHCGAIFDLTRRAPADHSIDAWTSEPPDAEPAERAPVPLPDRVRVERRGSDLTLSWRWFTPAGLLLLPFAVVWDGFLIFWYWIALSGGAPLIAILFPLVHVIVGVGITYTAVATLINTTTVRITAGMLTVRHAPLPWRPAPTVRTSDLEQLYVERNVSRRKNGTSVNFNVSAVTRDHTGRKLVSGLENLDQALYIEQEIEGALRIKDHPVAGEYRPDDTRV